MNNRDAPDSPWPPPPSPSSTPRLPDTPTNEEGTNAPAKPRGGRKMSSRSSPLHKFCFLPGTGLKGERRSSPLIWLDKICECKCVGCSHAVCGKLPALSSTLIPPDFPVSTLPPSLPPSRHKGLPRSSCSSFHLAAL